MMTVVTHVVLREGAEPEWDAVMHERLRAAQQRPGWIGGQLLIPLDGLNRRLIVGTWRTRADWEAWHQDPAFAETRERLAGLEARPSETWWHEVMTDVRREAGGEAAETPETSRAQAIPVRVYQTSDRIMVAAPMPGLEPENIAILVAGDRVVIRGEERGPHQRDMDLLVAEWSFGPYEREIALPQPVSGRLTNATYGNGVLLLSMPKALEGQAGDHAELRLASIDSTRGEHVGHVGRVVRPSGDRRHAA